MPQPVHLLLHFINDWLSADDISPLMQLTNDDVVVDELCIDDHTVWWNARYHRQRYIQGSFHHALMTLDDHQDGHHHEQPWDVVFCEEKKIF